MITKTRRWTFLARPMRGEHSLWRLNDDPKGTVYVADASGNNPDTTEDGPLRLSGVLWIRRGGSAGLTADVRVLDAMGGTRGYTMLHALVALWLIENEGFKVDTHDAESLRIMAKLLSFLPPAPETPKVTPPDRLTYTRA